MKKIFMKTIEIPGTMWTDYYIYPFGAVLSAIIGIIVSTLAILWGIPAIMIGSILYAVGQTIGYDVKEDDDYGDINSHDYL